MRGGYRILQGRVFSPSEKGTGGQASKAPRGEVWGVGYAPVRRKLCIFYIKTVSFYSFPVMFIDAVTFKKGTLIKRAGVRTPWTPPGSALGDVTKMLAQEF